MCNFMPSSRCPWRLTGPRTTPASWAASGTATRDSRQLQQRSAIVSLCTTAASIPCVPSSAPSCHTVRTRKLFTVLLVTCAICVAFAFSYLPSRGHEAPLHSSSIVADCPGPPPMAPLNGGHCDAGCAGNCQRFVYHRENRLAGSLLNCWPFGSFA